MYKRNIHRKVRGGGYLCDCPIGAHDQTTTPLGLVSSFIGTAVGLMIGASMLDNFTNISMIGEPSTGKSTLSKYIAKELQ